MPVDVRPMRQVPLGHLLRTRDAALAELWNAREAENLEEIDASPYVEADFELAVRELMCDTGAKLCRGWGWAELARNESTRCFLIAI